MTTEKVLFDKVVEVDVDEDGFTAEENFATKEFDEALEALDPKVLNHRIRVRVTVTDLGERHG